MMNCRPPLHFPAPALTATILALAFGLVGLASAESRVWTNDSGQSIQAEIQSATKTEVILQMANGKNYPVPIASLSEADQKYITEWLARKPSPTPKDGDTPNTEPSGDEFENWDTPWPTIVSSDNDPDIQELGQNEEGSWVYHSPNYEFVVDTVLSKSVVKRFAVLFEATAEYVRSMPMSMAKARSEKRHQILLFETRAAYYGAGAPTGSAGVYMPGKDVIMVPLTSLGVEKKGNRYIVDYDKGNKTLPHEITHQLTDRIYYQQGVVGWFTEGMAEYIGVTPYRSGKFNVKTVLNYLRDYVTAYGRDGSGGRNIGEDIFLPDLKKWMNQSYGQFLANPQVNYGCGALIFYYFAHMDGDKDAANLIAFCKALKEGKKGDEAFEALLAGRTWDQLEEDIKRGWSSRGAKFEFQ